MRFLTKRNLKLAGLYVGVLLAAILCSPLGGDFIIVLQFAPLPSILHGLVVALYAFIFPSLFLWLLAVVSAPILAVWAVVKERYRVVPLWLLVWSISWSAVPLSRKYDRFWNWRRAGLQRITVRAKPLIRAIDSHCVQEKQCPQSLEDLVPKYIAQIPTTGAIGYPEFRYKPPGESIYGNPYELLVSTPMDVFNMDSLVYWPDKKYQRQLYRGTIVRIGDWGYIRVQN